jgi:hypothetical protein
MTLKELSENFNFQNIEPLLEEYYPQNKRYLEFYVQIFNDIDELDFDDTVYDQGSLVKISKVKTKSVDKDGVYLTVCQAHLFTKDGWIQTKPSFEECAFSEIDYLTMEFFSDEEIFIRCLHGIFLKDFANKICEKLKEKKKDPPDTKKNDKEN